MSHLFEGTKGRGFTLIELLIVIAIILILIAIALPNFLEAQVRARVSNAKGALRAMEFAMNAHLLDWGCLPSDFNDSSILVAQCRAKGNQFGVGGPCSRNGGHVAFDGMEFPLRRLQFTGPGAVPHPTKEQLRSLPWHKRCDSRRGRWGTHLEGG